MASNLIQCYGQQDANQWETSTEEIANSVERDKFQIFEQWLLSNGTKLQSLELRDYGNEVRGCHATIDVGEEEIIINVPLKCLITVEMGKETDIGKAIIESNIELDAPKHIFLMIFMLIDRKNSNSFFKPYYDILPPTLKNMPIFWTTEELGFLQGSYLLNQIDERNQAIEDDYRAICGIVPEFTSICNLEEFKWARMCVCSRNFGLVANNIRTAALVPYADMLNHYRPRETKWQFDDALQGFTITTLQTIKAGAQVYDSYGQKCNHRFLLNYGFSVENNIEADGFCPNEVPLLLQLSPTDPLFDQKCEFYRRDAMFPSRRIRVCMTDNDNGRVMFALLRIIVADLDEFSFLTSSSSSPSVYRSIRDAQIPLGLRNEQRAMHALESLCTSALAAYPCSLEEDSRNLSETDTNSPNFLAPFSNHRHAVLQVKGEKEVLHFYHDFAQTALRLLSLPSSDVREIEAEIEKLRATGKSMLHIYGKGVVLRMKMEQRSQQVRDRDLDLTKPTLV